MDNESKNRKISFQDPSHFILKSFRNIDTLPDIIQLKPSQVIQYEVRNSSCKENQYLLFQMYLRSGMVEGIEKSLETFGVDTKFHFDLNLQSLRNEDIAPNQISLPQKRRSRKKQAKQESEDLEKGLNSFKMTPQKENDKTLRNLDMKTNEQMIKEILADVIKRSIQVKEESYPCLSQTFNITPFFNQTMSLTALHLAILSKQSGAVKCILNYILFNEDKDKRNVVETLAEVLSNEVEIDYHTDIFSKHEQALDGMNAFHLSCQYHPDALNVIFEAITDYEKKNSNDQDICVALKSILQRKNRVMNTTPLHVAVKRSLVDAVR